MLGNCFYVALAATLFGVPLMFMSQDPERLTEANTAGAWLYLTWWHVVCDAGLIVTFGAFFQMGAIYLMNPLALEQSLVVRSVAFAENLLISRISEMENALEEGYERAVTRRASRSPSKAGVDESPTGKATPEPAAPETSFLEKVALASGMSSKVPASMRGEKSAVASIGPVLDASYLTEGCSIVIHGWGRGARLPSEIYDAVVVAAGEAPRYAVQPTVCSALHDAQEELKAAKAALGVAQAAHRGSESTEAAVSARRRDVDAAATAVAAELELSRNELLDYAFLTFRTSAQKSGVLLAAKAGTLFPQVAADSAVSAAISVVPAPNPRDVAWRSLEATQLERRFSSAVFVSSMLAIGLMMSSVLAFTLTIGALLLSNTPFNGIADIMETGDPKRLGYFFIMFGIIFTAVQIMIQPLFCVYADRGLFCQPRLRLMTCTHTALFAKVGSFWMWMEMLILTMVFLFHVFLTIRDQPGYHFAEVLTNFTHTDNDEINFYLLYNGEVEGNIMLAALVESFLCIWVFNSFGRYVVAPLQKTQQAVDEACRMTDPAHLPFSTADSMRVIAAATLVSGLFPIACPMLLLYYPIAIFVVRTNLLGRFEPGPITKPLQYRFCFTIYLPLHLCLHLILSFGVYADVEVQDPQNFGSGLFPGFTFDHFCATPQKVVHSIFCLVAALVILFVLPYLQHRRCLREGVLTPFQIVALFFWEGVNDSTFAVSARVSVGPHHLSTPAYFQPAAADGSEPQDVPDPSVLAIPDKPLLGSLFEPISGVDLLSEPEEAGGGGGQRKKSMLLRGAEWLGLS